MLPGLGMVAGALGSVTDKIQDGIKVGFDYNRTLEESRLAFAKLLGSPAQAETHIRALQRLRREGISLEESASSSRRFQAARFDLEQIPAYIAAVGDASRISGAEVDAITRALTQMASKGRVSAEEVNQQLAEQGIPAWRYLADAVAEVDRNFAKLTTDERIRKVQKMAELGQLSGMGGAQAILRGIQKDFGGFSREFAEQTASGAEMQLEAAASRLAGVATGPLFERYKSLLRGVLNVANSETGEALARGAASGSNAVFNVMDEALKTGGSIGEGLFKGLGDAGFKAAGQFVEDFKTGIGANSPATEFIPVGASAAQGFKIGFSQEMQAGGGPMGFFQTGGGVRGKLEAAADNPTVRAFFEAIRKAEGGDPNRIVGGGTFSDMSRHPNRVGFVGPAGPSTAAGSYQITGTNWRRIAPILGLTDFAARNQLLAALYLFNEEGGLDRLLAGDIEGAIRIAGRDWAAVPGSSLPGRSVSQASFMGNFQQALGGGLAGMSVEQQMRLIQRMGQQFAGWPSGGGGDLTGGTGVFVAGAQGLGQTDDVVSKLDESIRETHDDAWKLTRVFMQPLVPFPGAIEQAEEFNRTIEQTVPILTKVKQEASFLGITGKDAAEAFEDAWVGAFTRTDLDFKGMASNLVLTFTQSINQMIQQWASAQISAGLSKFLSWGLNALIGGSIGGLSAGSQSSNSMFGAPGGGLTTGGPFMGPPAMRFATGGSFTVGGTGGTDKTPVSFWATKGEEVMVTPPGKRAGATVINNVTNNIIYSPRVTPSSYTSRRSQREAFEGLLSLAR